MASAYSPSDTFTAPSAAAVGAANNRAQTFDENTGAPGRRSRAGSLTQSFIGSNPRSGVWAVTGEVIARAPSFAELRRNSISSAGSTGRRKNSIPGGSDRTNGSASGAGKRRGSSLGGSSPREFGGRERTDSALIEEEKKSVEVGQESRQPVVVASLVDAGEKAGANGKVPLVEGDTTRTIEKDIMRVDQEPEAQPTWVDITKTGLMTFWRFFLTPMGFFITVYMLNVIAWGGMLFLLLCNAAPAMCHPTCDDINSPRRIWIEIDSQILNALFCVTGFGLIPWRFRDLYYLLQWRVFKKRDALSKLEGYHEAWFRVADGKGGDQVRDLEGGLESQEKPKRAPPTKPWKLDFVIWLYCWNTFLQCVLSGFMWGMNRHNRPSWSTGLFVALACIVAGVAGCMVWWETKKVKKIECASDGSDGIDRNMAG